MSDTLKAFVDVHAGAEIARRIIVGGIEGPDHFRDPVVVVFLQDVLDALDGGSKKHGLLALGNTPEERIAKGREALAAPPAAAPSDTAAEEEKVRKWKWFPKDCPACGNASADWNMTIRATTLLRVGASVPGFIVTCNRCGHVWQQEKQEGE